MPYQSSRYFDRAEEDVLKGENASYDIFITARKKHLFKFCSKSKGNEKGQ